MPSKPDPNSIPLAAGIESIAFAISASNAEKHGEPNPTGIFLATHSIIPPTDNKILNAAKKSLNANQTGYTNPVGITPLREAIASNLNEKFHLDLTKEQILITHGARFAIYLAVSTNMSPGGTALFFEPAYPAYRKIIENFEGRPVSISTSLEDKWEPNISHIEDYFDEPPDIIILNSPANPTGKILSKNIVDELVKYAVKKDIMIISDEVYQEYAFKSCQSILQYSKCKSIFISSFSKSYSMTGFRIGYAISSTDNISRMSKLGSLALTCLPEFVQRSALKALECQDFVNENVTKIQSRAAYLSNLLDDLPVDYYKPDGGFYIFPRVNQFEFNSEKFADNLLKKHHVSVVPGTAFGDYNEFLRISLCQPKEKLKIAIKNMEKALK
ncbi:pyridoxal phosphate-dependent aminotransferase [Thermoproteota archaeon]